MGAQMQCSTPRKKSPAERLTNGTDAVKRTVSATIANDKH